ncbi:hypothetical protein COV49_03595 [Candidatus Falkowbacteria bacterium CG11_big_fil_rev_8_21_14_0_20_39_10]|uniref:Uncharacterized protein n=1 Tax=Candidatus Falkowbacteria bacterium CG11_big_fil_rev_8_21_14_0_20_39_10 TaxID=1974570 RepID=A0A2M6K8A6_9BACT|nr:MAG: hypothetical protein COV49_03595 [Candidatus Falkowbacteria bacterium CG11_big_fil_rev_8_21_14_0_20_39_10]
MEEKKAVINFQITSPSVLQVEPIDAGERRTLLGLLYTKVRLIALKGETQGCDVQDIVIDSVALALVKKDWKPETVSALLEKICVISKKEAVIEFMFKGDKTDNICFCVESYFSEMPGPSFYYDALACQAEKIFTEPKDGEDYPFLICDVIMASITLALKEAGVSKEDIVSVFQTIIAA